MALCKCYEKKVSVCGIIMQIANGPEKLSGKVGKFLFLIGSSKSVSYFWQYQDKICERDIGGSVDSVIWMFCPSYVN